MGDLIEKCFHQLDGSKPIYIEGVLVNPCSTCTCDPDNNRKCPYYVPVSIEVSEEQGRVQPFTA